MAYYQNHLRLPDVAIGATFSSKLKKHLNSNIKRTAICISIEKQVK